MIRLTPRSSFQAALLATATFVLASAVAVQPTLAQSTQAQSTAVSQNAAAAAPESPYHGEVVEDIVARVNDQVISSSDFVRAEQDLETQAKQRNWSPQELDQQKRDLLRDLIDNQLLLSKGKQLGITGEAETIRQLDELRKQNHLDSMEALEKAAEQQNISFADFKASIQNRVITSQVIRDEVGRKINITQADEQQFYDEHQDQFTTPETVKLSEILVPTADPDNSAQVATAQGKADDIEAQLKAGKDFAALAKSDSGGSTAAQGGDLGEYKRGQLAKVLEDDTFSLKSGEFTAPIRTKQGFVILRVDNHTAAAVQPFSSVQLQVEDAVGSQKMQPALRQYLTRLREEAFIQVKPGYIDASATNTQFRPIFSAYQPPQPKKKKKLARTRFGGRGRARVARSAPAPVAPAGVPTLAEAGTASSSSTSTAGPAKTLKPGKREKVRYGQAPRETLPAASTQQEDAGASTAAGNNSTTETAAATTAATENDSTQQSNVSQGVHYANGESATTDQPVEGKKEKTRFSQRAVEVKAAKAEKKRKAKIDPYPNAPADRQEVSDRQEQSQALGLAGDTSKKKAKPKPTTKTRYSDEAEKKTTPDANAPADSTAPAAPVDSGVPAGSTAPANSNNPPPAQTPTQAPDRDAPSNTQSTPSGSGDPLGPPTPAPSQPQQPQR